MKDKNKRLLLSSVLLFSICSFSTSLAENLDMNEDELSYEEVMNEAVEETVVASEMIEEDIETIEMDEEYVYPSNRSDLKPNNSSSTSTLRAIDTRLSITEINRPKSDFIDVSSHNGNISVKEYEIMKSYGVTGVVVKLTEGTSYKNPFAANQIKNANAAGLLVSVYHYSWFETIDQAKAEANYFVNMANDLKLPKDTVFVSDLEDPKLKYLNNHTENSLAFEKQINARGFKNVNHYIGLHWINEKRIDVNQLGLKNVWVAAYPYVPSVQQHTEYGAWQWTSKMTFPGVHGIYDMSSDYNRTLSLPSQGRYISDGRFVEISKKGYKTYSDFDWKYRESSDSLIGNKYEARGRYEHSNGYTYLSLYDNQGKWAGYINAGATTRLKGAQGNYIADGRYVSISKNNYSIWQNFSWKRKSHTKDVYEKTYLAKGRYEHFNGSTYYSLYDGKDKWQGYLNASAATIAPNKNGAYISDGRYATISSKGYNTWQNFGWKFKHSNETIYQKTFIARGRYENINGSTYLSLFDNQGEWYGYINANGVKLSNAPQGSYMSQQGYASVVDSENYLFNNFEGKVRQKTSDVYQNTYHAKGRYSHFNGDVYYSLYNDKNVWQGYASEDIVRLNNNAQGPFIGINEKVTITKKNYNIWRNFAWKKKSSSNDYFNRELIAKGKYHHVNGSVYYSLYDQANNWIGYINVDGTK